MASIFRRIGTHDGKFHCDEVFACFMLKRLPEFTYAEIVRTRDSDVLKTCDIVVDVGGVYDPEKHRYDHHQQSFNHTMKSLVPTRPWTVRLSSAGLIYHHFGERVLESILGKPQDSELMQKLYNYVYEDFVQEIDGTDNGVPMFDGEPKYRICTSISSRVGNLNPAWCDQGPYDSQKIFHSAMDLVGKEFIDKIHYFTKVMWPARMLIKEALNNRTKVHDNGEIIELSQPCPWKIHLFQLEEELNMSGLIKFVIFKDKSWRVQAVPVEPKSYVCRVHLLENWWGLRDDELSQVSGINDCIFVHSTGFIGGHKTREGAIEMAVKSLKQ